MNQENIALLELAADRLGELRAEVAFVGGATVELWITEPAAPEFRPTGDIDVVIEVAALPAFHRFESRLRGLGFENDQESGLICRFKLPGTPLLLDVMPTESEILGFDNQWQKEAFPKALKTALPSGQLIQVIPPTYLLATKLEAFDTRGKGDFYGSRDFGDIVALVDGRKELGGEVLNAPIELRDYISNQFKTLRRHPSFESGIDGALLPDPVAQERADVVVKPRIDEMAAASSHA